MYNCWLAATSVAIVLASETWQQHLLHDPIANVPFANQSGPSAYNVSVRLWDTISGNSTNLTSLAYYQSKTEDRPGQRWWNSAFTQAILQLGARTGGIIGVKNDMTFDTEAGGDASDALYAMTGHSPITKLWRYYGPFPGGNPPLMCRDFYQAWINHSPLVLSTSKPTNETSGGFNNTEKGVVSFLYGNHAYALIAPKDIETIEACDNVTSESTVWFRNPWGRSNEFSYGDLLAHTLRVIHLRDFVRLDWEHAQSGKDKYWGTYLPETISWQDQPTHAMSDVGDLPQVTRTAHGFHPNATGTESVGLPSLTAPPVPTTVESALTTQTTDDKVTTFYRAVRPTSVVDVGDGKDEGTTMDTEKSTTKGESTRHYSNTDTGADTDMNADQPAETSETPSSEVQAVQTVTITSGTLTVTATRSPEGLVAMETLSVTTTTTATATASTSSASGVVPGNKLLLRPATMGEGERKRKRWPRWGGRGV